MNIRNLLSVCFIFIIPAASAQQLSSCENADFEMNNFSNWVGSYGYCCPVNVNSPGMVTGRHTIVTGTGYDPITQMNIPLVAPGGGLFSARLGNSQAGGQAEQLSYTFLVTPDNALFIYRYAVVLEDPGHSPSQQPRFSIRVFDQNNQPVGCGTYDVVSSANIPGFINVNGLRVKPWTTVGIELTAYLGQYITIEFTTADCGLGGHFGYAYMDCYCSPFTISSDLCPGSNTITLNAPTGFSTYLWSNGDTTANVTLINPVLGSTYSCTMTSVTGCQVTLQTVINPTIITADFYTIMRCANETRFIDSSYVVTGSPIQQWEWSFGDGTTSNQQHPVHSYAAPGFYSVQLVIFNSNCSDTITKLIYVKPSPVSNFTFVPQCVGDPINFINLSAFTAGTITSYSWNFGDGSPPVSQQFPVHTYSSAGPFDVSLSITSDNGCRDSIAKQLIPEIIPVAAVTFVPDCDTSAVQFTATTTASCGPVSGFEWNFGDGSPVSTDQNPSHIFPGSGTYNVVLTLTSLNGVQGTDTLVVVVPEKFTVAYTVNSSCLNQPTWLVDNTSQVFGTITSKEWYFGDGFQNFSGADSVQHIYQSAGLYTTSLKITTSNNCTDSISIPIEVYELPESQFVADTLWGCEPLQVHFIPTGSSPGGSINGYFWNFGDLFTDTAATPLISFPAGTFDVSLISVSDYGCADTIAITDYITAFPLPAADFIYTPEHITAFVPEVQFIDITDDAISWWWNFGDGTESMTRHPYHRFADSGIYPVKLAVTSSLGCKNDVTKPVEIVEEFTVYFPNAFTPNGDGVNDYFIGTGSNISAYEMNIFNRWGQVVFRTSDYSEGWDGRDAKGNITNGVYTFSARITDGFGKSHDRTGTLALIR